jgi:hypothetical protein
MVQKIKLLLELAWQRPEQGLSVWHIRAHLESAKGKEVAEFSEDIFLRS